MANSPFLDINLCVIYAEMFILFSNSLKASIMQKIAGDVLFHVQGQCEVIKYSLQVHHVLTTARP